MLLEGKNIIILGLMKFDGDIESTNFTIARQLAKRNKVFYVDNPYTWRDYIKLKGTMGLMARKSSFGLFAEGIIEIGTPNLKIVICPLVASIHFLPEGFIYRMALKLNQRLIVNRIKKVIGRYKLNNYIFINSYNFHYPNVGDMLKPALKVYHCVDPLVPPFDTKHGLISEKHIVATSDVVICSSRQLYIEKKQFNPHTYFVPNAADITNSQKALDPALVVDPILNNIPKPIIGYFGNIERRMDYDLLKGVIAENPDKSFVFVGPTGKEFIPGWFYNTPNIYLPGRVPYTAMPAVVKGFDVALLPFKKDGFSRTIFPLKLFEYLGAGKAVISTDFNTDLKDFTKDTVAYCETAPDFSAAINTALTQNTAAMLAARQAVAADNTWDKRGDEFSGIVNKYLAKSV